MKSPEITDAIVKIAVEFDLEPAALLAICHVESGGKVFARVGNRLEPLIRFEGHYFDRRLPAGKRKSARAKGLASPRAGAVANPRTQAGRWGLLRRAEAVDRQAARESVSWGLGQVMGAHWAWLGYGSVDDLVAEARNGVGGQVRLMVRFIRKAGLEQAIGARDWARFARGYNGPAYKKNRYDTKMAAAYRRYRKQNLSDSNGGDSKDLRRGAKGPAVTELQRKLTALGYPLTVDGDFGAATHRAVRQFQRQNGLAHNGIACSSTGKAIDRALPLSKGGNGILNWLRKLLGFGNTGR